MLYTLLEVELEQMQVRIMKPGVCVRSDTFRNGRIPYNTSTTTFTMRLSIFALLSFSLGLVAAKKSPQEELVALAAAGNGIITVSDERTFDLLTLPNRNWSVAVQFTALDKRRRCGPCK